MKRIRINGGGLAERMHNTERMGGCLIWTGATDGDGYGWFKVQGVRHPTHRAAWIETHGPILGGLWVLHECDNPPCVDVTHLFLGTPADNVPTRAPTPHVPPWPSERQRRSTRYLDRLAELKAERDLARSVAVALEQQVARVEETLTDLWRVTDCGCGHRADLHIDSGCIAGLTFCRCRDSFVTIVQRRLRATLTPDAD